MTFILGLSGKAQSGKTTCTKLLIANELNELGFRARISEEGHLLVITDKENQEGILDIESKRPDIQKFLEETTNPIIKLYSLAEPLKEICMFMFGLSYEQCYGTEEDKNTLTTLSWENLPTITTEKITEYKQKKLETDYGLRYHDKGFLTAREVMQYIGELFRKINPLCWIEATLNRIALEEPFIAIVNDMRYKNEVDEFKKVGAKVVRLTRKVVEHNHISEHDLDEYKDFDKIIDNQNMTILEMGDELMKTLLEWGWYKNETQG